MYVYKKYICASRSGIQNIFTFVLPTGSRILSACMQVSLGLGWYRTQCWLYGYPRPGTVRLKLTVSAMNNQHEYASSTIGGGGGGIKANVHYSLPTLTTLRPQPLQTTLTRIVLRPVLPQGYCARPFFPAIGLGTRLAYTRYSYEAKQPHGGRSFRVALFTINVCAHKRRAPAARPIKGPIISK